LKHIWWNLIVSHNESLPVQEREFTKWQLQPQKGFGVRLLVWQNIETMTVPHRILLTTGVANEYVGINRLCKYKGAAIVSVVIVLFMWF
jgi:hypothetical protein